MTDAAQPLPANSPRDTTDDQTVAGKAPETVVKAARGVGAGTVRLSARFKKVLPTMARFWVA